MSSEGLAELLPLLDERGPACSTGDFTKISNPYETVFRLCFTVCAGVAAVSAGLKATGFKTKVVEGRLPNEHRDRLTVKLKIMTMKPRDFKRNYRLDRKTFFHLLSLIRLDIEPSVISAIRAEASSGDSIDPVIQLAITLRILAGGSYLDIAFGYNVGNSTVYPIFWKVMEAINKRLSNIDFPWENEELLREMEGQFNNLSKGAFPGTVLAEMVWCFEEQSLLLRRWMGMCAHSMFVKVFGAMVCKHLLMLAVNSEKFQCALAPRHTMGQHTSSLGLRNV